MKIKTITCQHVYNYGATLQAYALQNYLESQGHEVEVIDYRLSSHIRYELFTLFPVGRAYKLVSAFPFLRFIIPPYKNRHMLKTWGRKKAFDTFDRKYLHLTEQTYRTYEELKHSDLDADVYIAGSDQIWNPEYDNGRDLGYYLNFGNRNTKKISYAASFGVSSISKEQAEFVKEQLSSFSHISVRETSGVEILKEIGFRAVACVDPVFLLRREDWIVNLNLKTTSKLKYIMVYDFNHDNHKMASFVQCLSKQTGLKVLSVNDASNAYYADIQINDAGPKEFLEYIYNAEFVVASSFHATAFSLIFNKKFVTYPLGVLSNSSRMENLLNLVGLRDRFCCDNINVIQNNIDWTHVNKLLVDYSAKSKEYLREAIFN